MLKLSMELSIEKAGELVSGLETLTNLPSVKITAEQLDAVKTQIDDIEISLLDDLSTEFLAKL